MAYKRRVSVSLRNDKNIWSEADKITDKIGFARFVVACILLHRSKNPVFLSMLNEMLKGLK